jgi:hypothetical protein
MRSILNKPEVQNNSVVNHQPIESSGEITVPTHSYAYPEAYSSHPIHQPYHTSASLNQPIPDSFIALPPISLLSIPEQNGQNLSQTRVLPPIVPVSHAIPHQPVRNSSNDSSNSSHGSAHHQYSNQPQNFSKKPREARTPKQTQRYNSISSSSKSSIDTTATIQQQLQEGILNNIIGNGDQLSSDSQEQPPFEFDYNLHYQCVDAFFSLFGIFVPFTDKRKHFERAQSFDLGNIHKLHPRHSFDLYMIFYLGYCILEKHDKISVNEEIKKYFLEMSVGKSAAAIGFNDLESAKNLILLGMYTMFENSGQSSWHVAGVLVRLVLTLSLNRKRANSDGMSEEDLEMENRVFWSAYNFDHWISVAFVRRNFIDNDDINIPYPRALPDEDPIEMEPFKLLLSMRTLGSDIFKHVHSANSRNKYPTAESRRVLMESLRARIEDWHNSTRSINSNNRMITPYVTEWHSMTYHHMLLCLYAPSFLNPDPDPESLRIVGRTCLSFIHHSAVLQKMNVVPLNWVQLYKFLQCSAPLLFCLCHEAIDLIDTRNKLSVMVEILELYSECWPLTEEAKSIYIKIINAITEISDKKVLIGKFYEYSAEFYDALQGTDLDFGLDHPVFANNSI